LTGKLHIRRARSSEYDRLAQLLDAAENSGVTGNELRDWDARLAPQDIHQRYVATLAETIIG
jgi:N-acetylglutamate synthase-like GNAT family acetyltransferase